MFVTKNQWLVQNPGVPWLCPGAAKEIFSRFFFKLLLLLYGVF